MEIETYNQSEHVIASGHRLLQSTPPKKLYYSSLIAGLSFVHHLQSQFTANHNRLTTTIVAESRRRSIVAESSRHSIDNCIYELQQLTVVFFKRADHVTRTKQVLVNQ
ncbi:uncharacterized protein [Rutidosis leptorrhynchoides]|uniref:uncharacterized protein isoform X2 n=1 Tax=Rutidosis leptorrhynchoides TaxID=125765 RepID=UPI003A997E6B